MTAPRLPSTTLEHRSSVVEADLRRALRRLAIPAVVATATKATFAIADAIYIGQGLGSSALAAVATSSFVLWSLNALTMAVSVGLAALLARNVGRSDARAGQDVVRQGLLLAAACGAVVALVGWPLAPRLFDLMAVAPDVAEQGTAYLRVLFLGAVTLFGFEAVEAAFRGSGDTRTPLVLLAAAVGANLVLDPLLIFGVGPLPRLGVSGAAAATLLAHATATAAGLVLLRHRELLAGGLSDWRPRLSRFARVLAIGSPVSLNGVFFCSVYMVLARITADFGTDALAALGVGHKCEAPVYFVGLGFSLAVAPLVGQSLGAGLPDRAERAAWLALRMACTWALCWTLVLLVAPRLVASAFIDEADVLAIAGRYLFILAWSQVFMAVEVTLEGAFAGAGKTLPPMAIGMPLAAARIPLAWLLAHPAGLGMDGIWVAISATSVARGLVLAAWFRRGTWKVGGAAAREAEQ